MEESTEPKDLLHDNAASPEAVNVSPATEEGATEEHQHHHHPADAEHGSSLSGAIFNFTNSIVGAGAIGLGGAIAESGGIISVVTIIFFAVLAKLSLDMLIRLSVEVEGAHGSYEDLGQVGFGWVGRLTVLGSKFLYSFGCLVAYVIVVKDNFGPAAKSLIFGNVSESDSWLYKLLGEDVWTTWILGLVVILPLCLLRDMTPLASLSVVSVVSMICIVGIVVYLYVANPNNEIRHASDGAYEDWFEVRPAFLECLGTFVFTFVSQHTVHLAFGSLKPRLRTVENWKMVSSYSILISGTVSLAVGVVVYMSFWEATESDIFEIYPAISSIDLAKLLLCVTMLLTFPLPFFTCRELVIILVWPYAHTDEPVESTGVEDMQADLQEPLLEEHENCPEEFDLFRSMSLTDLSVITTQAVNVMNSFLLPGEERQLVLCLHVLITIKLWFVVTALATVAPSLGDVLDLVGCATGTLIAFILPSLLALKLQGYSHLAAFILIVGVIVGVVGTTFSLKKLASDTF
jgi:amino acid permease